MWKLIITLVSTIFVAWIWQFLYWAWFKPRKIERFLRKQGMKGSPYRFLIGDAMETSRMYEKAFATPIGLNDNIAPRVMPNIYYTVQKYGNYSFIWTGPRPRMFITDPAVARDVLSKYRTYIKPFSTSNHIIKRLVGGLGTTEGDEWVKTRGKFNPAFNFDKLKPMVPAFQSCAVNTLNEWKEIATEKGGSFVVDMFSSAQLFTSAVLAQLMFSCDYTEEIRKTFMQLAEFAAMGKLASKLISLPGEKYLPTKVNRRSKEILKYVRVVFTKLIKERLERNEVPQSGNWDILDMLLQDIYAGKTTTERERQNIIEDAIAELRVLFFAGFDTSSILVTWTLVQLSIHQEWQARAREEIFQVLGNKKDITYDDLTKLKTLTNIINETLRLYPPAMEITRLVDQETKINDQYTIPKGTLISFPTLMIHRDPQIWGKDAGEFKPDRFAEGVLKASNGETAFFPFGWGPRICLGMNFSLIESKAFVAMLLRQFSFELSPTYTHAPAVNITMQPQYGAPMVLKKL